jgi:hypothetical protein
MRRRPSRQPRRRATLSGCSELRPIPFVAEVSVLARDVVIWTLIWPFGMNGSNSESRGQLLGLADPSLRRHQRDALSVELEPGDVVIANGTTKPHGDGIEEREGR